MIRIHGCCENETSLRQMRQFRIKLAEAIPKNTPLHTTPIDSIRVTPLHRWHGIHFETVLFRHRNCWYGSPVSCTMHKHRRALPAGNCNSQRPLCGTCEGYFFVFFHGPHRKDWDCLFANTMSGPVSLFLLSKAFKHFTLTPISEPLAIWLWLHFAVRIAN